MDGCGYLRSQETLEGTDTCRKNFKATKRTIGALRVKASQMGIGLGHQR
jgi:hypothetical protein